MRFLLLVLIGFSPLCLQARTPAAPCDTVAKRPDLRNTGLDGIKWARAEGGSFWFYHKPSQYFFDSKEFQTITLENGDVLVYLFNPGIYLLLVDFSKAPANAENTAELASSRSCVFVRRARGSGFFILDKGLFVSAIERIGLNTDHQYVFRSRLSDKRYWINESDFLSAPVSKPIGILSE